MSTKAGDKLGFLKDKDGVNLNVQLALRCTLWSNDKPARKN